MTKQEILAYKRDYLTPAQVAGILHCDPQLIRIAARSKRRDVLGFSALVIGNRTKIPRKAFIRAMGWE